jgi:hypothetical protein
MRNIARQIVLSVLLHAIVLGAIAFFFHRTIPKQFDNITSFQVEIESSKARIAHSGGASARNASPKNLFRQANPGLKYDLRPSFWSGDWTKPRQQDSGFEGKVAGSLQGLTNDYARDLLLTESKVMSSFDQLATLINGNLEFPIMLVEHGVQGIATLDLYFDQNGSIDEEKSSFSGDNRMVRGLLVKAVRKGLVNWYRSGLTRLEKEKLRNQHFRSDFVISYFLPTESALIKTNESAYKMLRRELIATCIAPTPSGFGLDVTCTAVKVAGSLKRAISDTYKGRYMALTESLSDYDRMGLEGINRQI